jgi:membrane-associated protease RseP (regulator of RpoE activity)
MIVDLNILIAVAHFWLVCWLVITTHELGHYFAARFYGIPVSAFSSGVGMRFLNFYHQGIRFEFRIWPINGYVRYLQMPRTARHKIVVITAAAPATNFVLGAVILYLDRANLLGAMHIYAGMISMIPTGGNDGAVILHYFQTGKIKGDLQ